MKHLSQLETLAAFAAVCFSPSFCPYGDVLGMQPWLKRKKGHQALLCCVQEPLQLLNRAELFIWVTPTLQAYD